MDVSWSDKMANPIVWMTGVAVAISTVAVNSALAQHVVTLLAPTGEDYGSWVGQRMGGARTTNGVGFVLMAAEDDSAPTGPNGRAYVFSAVDGAVMYELLSPSKDLRGDFGALVGSVGDVTGDGTDEVLVSEHVAGPIAAGCVHMFSGENGEFIRTLWSPNPTFGGNFGVGGMVGIGDLTGDGYEELLIGAIGDVGTGRAYVVEPLWGRLRLELAPSNPQSAHFGSWVAGAGDMTGDGIPDILVVASRERENGGTTPRGVTYLFSGADGSMVRRMPGVKYEVASIEDVSGDGVRDIVAAWENASVPGYPPQAGAVWIYSGATGELVRTLTPPVPEEAESFGQRICVIADLTGDGVEDIVISDMHARIVFPDLFFGAVYVYSGATGEFIRRIVSPAPMDNGLFGMSIAVVPDSNADGRDEIAVGAPGEWGIGIERHAYLFHSCPGDFDGDGTTNSADFFLFLHRFFEHHRAADLNRNGACDSADFFEYLTLFFRAC